MGERQQPDIAGQCALQPLKTDLSVRRIGHYVDVHLPQPCQMQQCQVVAGIFGLAGHNAVAGQQCDGMKDTVPRVGRIFSPADLGRLAIQECGEGFVEVLDVCVGHHGSFIGSDPLFQLQMRQHGLSDHIRIERGPCVVEVNQLCDGGRLATNAFEVERHGVCPLRVASAGGLL